MLKGERGKELYCSKQNDHFLFPNSWPSVRGMQLSDILMVLFVFATDNCPFKLHYLLCVICTVQGNAQGYQDRNSNSCFL